MTNLAKIEAPSLTIQTVDQMKEISSIMYQSGMFSDTKSAAQIFVKVMAGSELGFKPFAAITGIAMIQGKPSIGANLIAAAIKANPKYRYKIVEHNQQTCKLECLERVDDEWESMGISEFSMEDAKTAGLTGKSVWKSYPKAMLFARAISQAARFFFADVFLGSTVYTAEELGATETDEFGASAIDVEIVQPKQSDALPFSSMPEAIEWAMSVLSICKREAEDLLQECPPDANGAKAVNFHKMVLERANG